MTMQQNTHVHVKNATLEVFFNERLKKRNLRRRKLKKKSLENIYNSFRFYAAFSKKIKV